MRKPRPREVKDLVVGDIVGMQQTTVSLEPCLFHYTILPLPKHPGVLSYIPRFLLLKDAVDEIEKLTKELSRF